MVNGGQWRRGWKPLRHPLQQPLQLVMQATKFQCALEELLRTKNSYKDLPSMDVAVQIFNKCTSSKKVMSQWFPWLHKGGSWQLALELFSNASCNLAVSNAAISACGKGGQWRILGVKWGCEVMCVMVDGTIKAYMHAHTVDRYS